MTSLILESSLCKTCGVCCFNCEYLSPEGCINENQRLNSRCISFPLIFGNPLTMGYSDIWSLEENELEKWFIIEFFKCKIIWDEKLFQFLRIALQKLNRGDVTFFSCSFDNKNLILFSKQ